MLRLNQTDISRRGFTVVELVIIIAVIGILLAISTVGYGAWRDNIAKTEVVTDLQAVKSAMEDARNWGDGFPLAIPDNAQPSQGVTVTYVSGDATTFCVEAVSVARPDIQYFVSATTQDPQPGDC